MKIRGCFLALLLVGGGLCLPSCFKAMTGGFHLGLIQVDGEPTQGIPLLAPEMRAIFEQPYFYLDKGAQCYVFESADGKWILKLFRTYPRASFFQSWWHSFFHRRTRNPSSRVDKIHRIVRASQIAFDYAREETGLVYIHPAITDQGLPVVDLFSGFSRKTPLSLDRALFALQKKAVPLERAFFAAQGDPKKIETLLFLFLDLIERRSAKGIVNSDGTIERNFGFIGDQAIEIDFGNYTLLDELTFKENRWKEIGRFVDNIAHWMDLNVPGCVAHFTPLPLPLSDRLSEGDARISPR